MIELLDERDMLPALYFIFSRAGCEEAVATCLDAGLRLTTPDERVRIRAIVDEHTAALSDDDLDVLGYDRWAAAVPMFLPRIQPAGPRSSRFEWARVRRNREWRTALAIPVMALALYARARWL